MSYIRLVNVTKRFGNVTAVDNLNLEIGKGECFSMLGPSGCGKTTTLRMVAGFEDLSDGEVWVGDRLLSSPKKHHYTPPENRNFGMVFQAFAVWPHMSVYENVAFPLRLRKLPAAEIEQRTKDALTATNLLKSANESPASLSGGGKQRVALARALAINPDVMLLDEPLSSLDPHLREEMRFEIKDLQRKYGFSIIYVTHDQSEAMALSDRIIIMRSGVVEQIGTPQEIYYHPVNEFVADFIGEANFLKGRLEAISDNRAQLNVSGDICHAAPVPGMEVGRDYTIVLRPEAASLAEEGGLPCEVVLSCFMGSYQNYHVKVGDTLVKLTDPNPKNKRIYKVGERCRLVFDPESVHVL